MDAATRSEAMTSPSHRPERRRSRGTAERVNVAATSTEVTILSAGAVIIAGSA
jgi:hypothetical protein